MPSKKLDELKESLEKNPNTTITSKEIEELISEQEANRKALEKKQQSIRKNKRIVQSLLQEASSINDAEKEINPLIESCEAFYCYFSGIPGNENSHKIDTGLIRRIGIQNTDTSSADELVTTLNKLDTKLPSASLVSKYLPLPDTHTNDITILLKELMAKLPIVPIKAKAIQEVIEKTNKVCDKNDKYSLAKQDAETKEAEKTEVAGSGVAVAKAAQAKAQAEIEKKEAATTLENAIEAAKTSIKIAINTVLLSDIYTLEDSEITHINDHVFPITQPDLNQYSDYFEIFGNTILKSEEIKTEEIKTSRSAIITNENNKFTFESPQYAYDHATGKNHLKDLATEIRNIQKELSAELGKCNDEELKPMKTGLENVISDLNEITTANFLFKPEKYSALQKKLRNLIDLKYNTEPKDKSVYLRTCLSLNILQKSHNNINRVGIEITKIRDSQNRTYSTEIGQVVYIDQDNYTVTFNDEYKDKISNSEIQNKGTVSESEQNLSIHIQKPYSPNGAKLIKPKDLFIKQTKNKSNVALISFLPKNTEDTETAQNMQKNKDSFLSNKYFYVDGHGSPFSMTMGVPEDPLDAYAVVDKTDELNSVKEAANAYSYSKRDLFVLRSIIDKHNQSQLPIVFLCCSLGAGERSFAECFSKIVHPLTVYAANATVSVSTSDITVITTILFKDSKDKKIPTNDNFAFLNPIKKQIEEQLTNDGHFRIFNYARRITSFIAPSPPPAVKNRVLIPVDQQ